MKNNKILEAVERFADHAHGAQTRKYSNDRYIVHPVRVMKECQIHSKDIAVHAAALLHDVLEDTPITKAELFDFLLKIMDIDVAERTIKLVEELTDIYTKQNFPSLNRKTRKLREAERLSAVSADAQTIKYADIIDNSDVITNDPDFARVYVREAAQMLEGMHRGNAVLRDKAINRLKECDRILKNMKIHK